MSDDRKAYVANAADPQQVSDAKKKEKFKRRSELDDIRFLLQYVQFRRFIWRLLDFCSVFNSIWHPSAAIHHSSGKQDTGHWAMAELNKASQDSFLIMMKENYKGQE